LVKGPQNWFASRLWLRACFFLLFLILPVFLVSGCFSFSADQLLPQISPPQLLPAEKGSSEGAKEGVSSEEREKHRLEEEARKAEEERALLEERRKAERGPFYVPLPLAATKSNPPVKAKGLYLTGNTAGLPTRYRELLKIMESTELNSVVIDVKNDHGLMTYQSALEIVQEVGANSNPPIADIKSVLEEFNDKDIYTIARIVVFKDPLLAEQKPEWAIKSNAGGVWRDRKGVAWIDPYQKKVWDYNIAIAQEAALMGFREIQFDYVRFPENARLVDKQAYYPAKNNLLKDEVIRDFLVYAAEQLEEYNIYLAADVFGVIATSWGDSDQIGQTWEEIAPFVDYICPMIYPSHYGPGYFGLKVPDAHPITTVNRALTDALKRNAPLESPAVIRPWLQSFTASWVQGHIPYGPAQIKQQIEEAYRLGIDEYLLWNANNHYYPSAPFSAAEGAEAFNKFSNLRREAGKDALGRTPEEAVAKFLEAIQKKDWREAYALQITDHLQDHHTYPQWKDEWRFKLTSYQVRALGGAADSNPGDSWKRYPFPLIFAVQAHLASGGNGSELEDEIFEARLEHEIWRVKPSSAFLEALTRKVEEDEIQ
jgi:hypothetical protein